MNFLPQILRLLASEKSKGKAIGAHRGILMFAVLLIGYKVNTTDSRLSRIEGRLGITNEPVQIQIPFTLIPPTNTVAQAHENQAHDSL